MISPSRLLPLFLLSPTLALTRGFVAYKEKGCNDPLDIWSDGVQIPNNTLLIDHSIREQGTYAGGRTYENMTFPAAHATGDMDQDAGVQFVYWKIEQPDPGCQYMMMKETPRGWQVLSQMPGDEMLRIAQEGCYYTALAPNDNVITSYCCGRDDCAVAEVEYEHKEAQDTTNGGDPPTCTVKKLYSSSPTVEDGEQIAVTRPQTCEAPPACTHSITQSRQISTAVSHFQSFSWTTEEGIDVSFEAGINFIEQSTIKTGLALNIAQSWMDETGTTLTQTNITAAQEAGRQEVGTVAFYSFTPQYDCWKGDVSCGKDNSGNEKVLENISFCQPRISTTGDPAGVFRMVYTSG
ncbi:uncharacterized protein F4822DRAFT_440697 [Hypoxylon trugodes]|uniref:uncharacterized protein n=1 Tax=Hypoxylon trugodes TaxID=326681 RepID=UPI00218EAC0E|nr:uncharacterized protein F4822DRAFT_440697 [Hypoxylon trugodes]KAI1382934.1 hypothetical protein F4822DRAFT_440697 [Hypoxylon trugodes]